jgi:hypothetical protein
MDVIMPVLPLFFHEALFSKFKKANLWLRKTNAPA